MTKLSIEKIKIEKVNVSGEGKAKLSGEWKVETVTTDIIINPKVYKYLERKLCKKIKRRILYEISWWSCESRNTKCFYSAQKMRKFVNELHSWYNDYIEIEKTWCYREYSPRHKWYYISFEPNQFVCVEKW